MLILANTTHPVVILLVGIWGAPIVGGGLLVEAWFALWRFGLRPKQVIAMVLITNVITALLAVPLATVSIEWLSRLEESMDLGWRDHAGLPSFALAFIGTTLVNAIIEAWVIRRFWKVPSERHVFRWWLLANALSNGLVFLAFIVLFTMK